MGLVVTKVPRRGTCPLTMISLHSDHERLRADGGVHRAWINREMDTMRGLHSRMYKMKARAYAKKNSPTIGAKQGGTRKDLPFPVPVRRRSVNRKHDVDQRTHSLVGGPESRSQPPSYRTLR